MTLQIFSLAYMTIIKGSPVLNSSPITLKLTRLCISRMNSFCYRTYHSLRSFLFASLEEHYSFVFILHHSKSSFVFSLEPLRTSIQSRQIVLQKEMLYQPILLEWFVSWVKETIANESRRTAQDPLRPSRIGFEPLWVDRDQSAIRFWVAVLDLFFFPSRYMETRPGSTNILGKSSRGPFNFVN